MHKRDIALWGTMLAAPAQAEHPGLGDPPAFTARSRAEVAAPAAGAVLLPRVPAVEQPVNPYADARPLSEWAEAEPVNPFAGSRPVGERPEAWML